MNRIPILFSFFFCGFFLFYLSFDFFYFFLFYCYYFHRPLSFSLNHSLNAFLYHSFELISSAVGLHFIPSSSLISFDGLDLTSILNTEVRQSGGLHPFS